MLMVFIYSIGHAKDIVSHRNDNFGTGFIYTVYNANSLILVESKHFINSVFSNDNGNITFHYNKVNPALDAMRNENK